MRWSGRLKWTPMRVTQDDTEEMLSHSSESKAWRNLFAVIRLGYIITIPFKKRLIFSLFLPSLYRYIIIIVNRLFHMCSCQQVMEKYYKSPISHWWQLQEEVAWTSCLNRGGFVLLLLHVRCASCRTRLGFEGLVRLRKAKLVTSQVSLSTHHHRWVVPQVS